jgi:polyhydroxybutyrate depolymerase
MKKEIIGIFAMTLLLTTTTLPVLGELNQLNETYDENLINNDLNLELRYLFHKFLIRNYYVYKPLSYDGFNDVPLVVMLHGYGHNGLNFSERCMVNEKAEEEGFIVVYPTGFGFSDTRHSWNVGFGYDIPYIFNFDDVGFIKKVIEKMQKDYNIDTDKIYVAGYSAGAAMAYHLACELPEDIVAAYAIQSGAIGGHIPDKKLWTNKKPGHPVSIVIFHGKKDLEVKYNGGWNPAKDVFYLSVSDAVDFWVENNRCNPEPVTEVSDSEQIIIDRYSDGDDNSEIVLYTVEYGVHGWFGEEWMIRDPVKEISTTDEMWDFFEAHSLL